MPATTNGKTKANGKADGENGNKSLLERVEAPSDLPKETRSKIARLEYEFARAEFEQCMFSPFLFPFFSCFYVVCPFGLI